MSASSSAHDYYQTLQVPPNAGAEVIQTAYRRLAFLHHPDRNLGDETANEKMQLLNEAYEVLSNPEKRQAYDMRRRQPGTSRPKPEPFQRKSEPANYHRPPSPRPSSSHSSKSQTRRNTNLIKAIPLLIFGCIALFVIGMIVIYVSKNSAKDLGGHSQFLPDEERPDERQPGQVAEVEIAWGIKMKFCWIPRGSTKLGSPESENGRSPDEVERDFTTRGFWLGKYAVTQEEWFTLMRKNPSNFVPLQDTVKTHGIRDTNRFPVEMVSWKDCLEFLKKLNDKGKGIDVLGNGKFCLPREDEWEYAARGGKGNGQPFYFGSELNGTQANCRGTTPYGTKIPGPFLDRTEAVGTYEREAKHPWGLCDMAGNVLQWCDDKFDNKSDDLVLRGGSWFSGPIYCRSACRSHGEPTLHKFDVGCRVCFRVDD